MPKDIVIDADIAKAAGENSQAHESRSCHRFLKAFGKSKHRVVFSKRILEEWNRRASLYAKLWLNELRKNEVRYVYLKKPHDQELRDQVNNIDECNEYIEKMMKDIHLVEAARVKGKRIASKDNDARKKFSKFSMLEGKKLRRIMWVNPTEEEGCCEDWLKNEAVYDSKRCLGEYCSVT